MLRIVLMPMLLLAALPAFAIIPAAAPTGLDHDVRFCVLSDPHYFAPELGTTGAAFAAYVAQDRKLIAESHAITLAAIEAVRAEQPSFLLIAGDLTKDGERASHEKLVEYLHTLKESGTQVYVVPGNHDVLNPEAYSYSGELRTAVPNVTPEEFASIYADFGYGKPLARDPYSLSYVVEAASGLWLFGLDPCSYGHTEGGFTPQTLEWVQSQLAEARRQEKVVIGLMHHGAMEHWTGQSLFFGEYVIRNWQQVSAMLARNGMAAVFTGHFHAQDIVSRQFEGGAQLLDVETGSLVTYPCPFRTVTLRADLRMEVSTRQFGSDEAEVTTIGFENVDLPAAGYIDASTAHPAHHLDGVTFTASYNSDWGTSAGVAISTMGDTITAGYLNPYSSITASGAEGSRQFAIVNPFGLTDPVIDFGRTVEPLEVYITNNVYAAISMRDGDQFAKAFSAADQDYFEVTFIGLDAAGDTTGSITSALADFRRGSSLGILKVWQRVDLTPLKSAVKIAVSFASSDVGTYGINTPLYVAIDNLKFASLSLPSVDYPTGGKTFAQYARDYLQSGLLTLSGALIAAPVDMGGFGATKEQAAALAPAVTQAMMAHYAGDEAPPTQVQTLISGLLTGTDATSRMAGNLLGSLWTDLPPADNEVTVQLHPASLAVAASPLLSEHAGTQIMNTGFGSAIARLPGIPGAFYLLTDRGPNVDGTSSDVKIFADAAFTPRIGRFRVEGDSLELISTIEMKDISGRPLSGLPNPAGMGGTGEIALDLSGTTLPTDSLGIDPEGLVALRDGTFWVSDEYGPHLVHFDANGRTIERLNPFGPTGRALPKVFATRRPNRGMEGLTIMPDGRTLVGLMQSPLYNPGKSEVSGSLLSRILTYDTITGATRQYAYLLDNKNTANSEILALTDTTFLVLERDGAFLNATKGPVYKLIYLVSINGATDVSDPLDGVNGRRWSGKTLEELKDAATLQANGIVPVRKRLLIDLAGLGYIHDKPEGLTILDAHTLAVSNDDDFGIVSDGNGGLAAKLVPTADGRTFVDRNVVYFIHLDEGLEVDRATAIATQLSAALPERFALDPAYPNPFNPSTVLTYALTETGPVQLIVYNSAGQQVTKLVSEVQTPGRYRVVFEAGSLASGVYLAQLRTERHVYVRRLVLAR